MLKVNLTKAAEAITIYPNPANGNEIGLQVSMEKCSGTVTIYNSNAQPVFMAAFSHPGNTSASMISLKGKTLPKGNYTLLFNNGTKNFSKTMLIN